MYKIEWDCETLVGLEFKNKRKKVWKQSYVNMQKNQSNKQQNKQITTKKSRAFLNNKFRLREFNALFFLVLLLDTLR